MLSYDHMYSANIGIALGVIMPLLGAIVLKKLPDNNMDNKKAGI